jgi:hypothetical protein
MKLLAGRLLPFLILFLVVLGCTKLAWQAPGKLEEQDRVTEILNAKFDLANKATVGQAVRGIRYDCEFKCWQRLYDNKITLMVYFCESTSSSTKERKLSDFLTPENLALIKNAGFEQVKLYELTTDKLVDSVDIHQ